MIKLTVWVIRENGYVIRETFDKESAYELASLFRRQGRNNICVDKEYRKIDA